MDEPIPVSLAKTVLERAIRECDAGLAWTRLEWRKNASEHVRFVLLARAGFRASLVHLLLGLRVQEIGGNQVAIGSERVAVAPLIDHYDRVAPGWRTE